MLWSFDWLIDWLFEFLFSFQNLKDVLAKKIPEHNAKVKAFRTAHNATKVGEVTLDQVRNVKSTLIYAFFCSVIVTCDLFRLYFSVFLFMLLYSAFLRRCTVECGVSRRWCGRRRCWTRTRASASAATPSRSVSRSCRRRRTETSRCRRASSGCCAPAIFRHRNRWVFDCQWSRVICR